MSSNKKILKKVGFFYKKKKKVFISELTFKELYKYI